MDVIVTGDGTSTGNTSEDISTSTLEEGEGTFLGDNLLGTIDGTVVLDGLTGGHHHSSSDGIDGIRSQTSEDGNGPANTEVNVEVVLQVTGEQGLDGVVETEVKTSVDNDTDARDNETSVETGNTIGGEGLFVDIDQTAVLLLTTLLGRLQVIGQFGSGEIQRVDEGEGDGTSQTTGSHVSSEPDSVTVFFLFIEHSLEGILEGEVQGLSGEVSQDIGPVTLPESLSTFFVEDSLGTVGNTGISSVQSTLLDHFVLILNSHLDNFNGRGNGLGDGGGDTTGQEILNEIEGSSLLLLRHFI